MYQGKLLETRDIKLINGLMVQGFFGTTQMNGPSSAKIPEVDSINHPEFKRVTVINMVGQHKIFCQFSSQKFQLSEKEKSSCISDVA